MAHNYIHQKKRTRHSRIGKEGTDIINNGLVPAMSNAAIDMMPKILLVTLVLDRSNVVKTEYSTLSLHVPLQWVCAPQRCVASWKAPFRLPSLLKKSS